MPKTWTWKHKITQHFENILFPPQPHCDSAQWARNGFEFFEEQRQKPIEGMKLRQKVYGKQGSYKSYGSPFG